MILQHLNRRYVVFTGQSWQRYSALPMPRHGPNNANNWGSMMIALPRCAASLPDRIIKSLQAYACLYFARHGVRIAFTPGNISDHGIPFLLTDFNLEGVGYGMHD